MQKGIRLETEGFSLEKEKGRTARAKKGGVFMHHAAGFGKFFFKQTTAKQVYQIHYL